MPEDMMRALFLLAGIPVQKVYRLANGYCSASCCADKPWWLVQTPRGFVEVGWRKRVISITWGETDVRRIVTRDDVTKDERMVHAYGYAKAVEYLTTLAPALTVTAPPLAETADAR